MHIRAGFEIAYDCPKSTPMLLVLSIHPSRTKDLQTPHRISFDREVSPMDYVDGFGNVCTRITAPQGRTTIRTDFVIADSGLPDVIAPEARQHPIEELPQDTLVYLLGSRYCETDRLGDAAWALFANTEPGWSRVQAICDYVHNWITFGYHYARSTMSAWDSYMERKGVCRDFAHLAITMCRCMNIPARYCTGYMGDIGVPVVEPMDFSAWFEVYLGGRWYTFDARNNRPRIGRILMARGRDATDVAISTSFGTNTLAGFKVFTDEVPIQTVV
ncbi:MAG TPA: transglutaminase family protein [Burkholderiales bacterium]|jgi:transglutaminase-like putative cysteine protease|nr:transglutaminase family protein [Burkholderiales bacterium]